MWYVLGLFVAGIVFIFSEFFIPGLIVGTLGVILLLVSTVYGWYLFPEYGPFIAMGEFIGLVASIALGMYAIANTRLGNFLIMNKTQDASEGWHAPAQDPALMGQEGTVYTALRPAGKILVNGDRIDAVSTGTFIDAETTVRVVEVEGSSVVVERSDLDQDGADS